MNNHFIKEDSIVLTPNRRLSAELLRQYQINQRALGNKTWPTPLILPVSTWIQQLWQDNNHLDKPILLLSTEQEQSIWESILLDSKEHAYLLQISETSDLIRSAWSLLKQWRVDLNHEVFQSSNDYVMMHQWLEQFQLLSEQQNWIDAASLPDKLSLAIDQHLIKPPKHIILYGFLELTPQLSHLLKTCEIAGSEIIEPKSNSSCQSIKRISIIDKELEIQTMARWAKTISDQHPNAHIGCVFQSLAKNRDRVKQVFSEVFSAENTYTVDILACPFNISAGKNLSQYPVIKAVLAFLNLYQLTLSHENLGYLLASPFMGEAECERLSRANFYRLLRNNNKNSINIFQASQIEDPLSLNKFCPKFANRIRNFFALLPDTHAIHTYAEWTAIFHALLKALGWPGERSLNSEEYQVVENFLQLFYEYKSLDFVSEPTHLQQALHTLTRMAEHRNFQPQTPDAKIQVLGLFEAAGMSFDYVWIAGIDDLTWPLPPAPHPFIPKSLQRELQMPHATAERELVFCQMVLKQFQQSSNHLIFSHAEQHEGLALQPSPLIKDIEIIKMADLQLENYMQKSQKIFMSRSNEIFIDEHAPAITRDEVIRGGVSLLKSQALCPFKSFAEWRLHAQDAEEPLPGLRAKDRGTLTHKTLELVWSTLKDHDSLMQIQEAELNQLIETAINDTFEIIPHSLSELTKFAALEKMRLHKLIREWLDIEKQRPTFKVIQHEAGSALKIGPLSLTIKIDRIDELSDGKKLIIDYKTGKNNDILAWFSDRPEEPQLPLYALFEPEQICGITFAQVHVGEHKFKGLSHYSLDVPGIKLVSEIKKTTAFTWAEQVKQWETVLVQLSDAFYNGDAKVDPKDSATTCTWCKLNTLCRVNEVII